jgi:hypothetical protein
LNPNLLDDPFCFGVVSHITVVNTVLTRQVSISTCFIVLVLSSLVKIYDDEFFNHMFDLELPKFWTDLERIYGRQPFELINVNINSRTVFNNLQNCPITINVIDPRVILGLVADVVATIVMPKVFIILTFFFSLLVVIVINLFFSPFYHIHFYLIFL